MSFVKKLSNKKESLIIYGLVLCVLLAAALICPPFYSMNDDPMMKSILSGAYTGTPDGHAVYMKYPLTGILSLLYRIAGGIPWFDLMLTGCFWLSISAVIDRVLVLGRKHVQGKRVLLWATAAGCLCFGLFLPHLLTLHYTLVAAMVGACALFLVLTGGGYLWAGLLILCYCVRSQVFFLLLPFLGVAVLWRLAEKKKEGLVRELAVLAAGVVICMLWNGLMYRGTEWQQYMEYNDSRTQVYDYNGLLPYEENADLFEEEGISREIHRVMEEYVLVLDEGITAETLDKADSMAAERLDEQRNDMAYLAQCIKEYYYHIRYTDMPYNILLIAGYLLVAVLLLKNKYFVRLALLGCMAGGRSLIWIFLIWRGRFPERIYISLYFLDLLLLAAMAFKLLLQVKLKRWICGTLAGIACVILLAAGTHQLQVMRERTLNQKEKQKEWEALTDYCREDPDTVYLLDVLSVVSYTGRTFQTETGQENHLLAGGWMSNSPLLTKRLGDAKDAGGLLAGQDRSCCYVIKADKDISWLQDYLGTRFDGLRLEKIDSVSVDGKELFSVYRPAGR